MTKIVIFASINVEGYIFYNSLTVNVFKMWYMKILNDLNHKHQQMVGL